MDRLTFAMKLEELRNKQQLLTNAWEKVNKNQLLELFVELLPPALNVERCGIFILDPKEDNVWLRCGTGVEQKQIQVPRWGSMVGTVISTIIFFKLVQISNAIFASSVAFTIPIVAMFWGYIDGEYLGVFHFLGMLMILVGVYVIRKSR